MSTADLCSSSSCAHVHMDAYMHRCGCARVRVEMCEPSRGAAPPPACMQAAEVECSILNRGPTTPARRLHSSVIYLSVIHLAHMHVQS